MESRMACHHRVAVACTALALASAGCHPLGSRQLPIDRFDYNTAIAVSANEQMLLNLVRLRHGEVPTFLAVTSVLTQYVWSGDVGVGGTSGENLSFPAWTVGGSAGARYIERPTVSYAPLSGQEFAAQLLSPVRADVVFSLVSSGWPPDQLLSMTIQRINNVENVRFSQTLDASAPVETEFNDTIQVIIELARRDALELVRTASPDREETFLEFRTAPDAETAALITRFKSSLSLDPDRSRFRVTRRIVGRAPDEITIRMHSLLELMGLLSTGVATDPLPAGTAVASSITPVHIQSGPQHPTDALVAVKYNGSWFWVSRSDESSKRAFGLLIYLFQMQASQNAGAGPLITVPIG